MPQSPRVGRKRDTAFCYCNYICGVEELLLLECAVTFQHIGDTVLPSPGCIHQVHLRPNCAMWNSLIFWFTREKDKKFIVKKKGADFDFNRFIH